MTTGTTAKLGKRQESVLEALNRYGSWPRGWKYGGPRETDSILASLVRKGLARRTGTDPNGYGIYEKVGR